MANAKHGGHQCLPRPPAEVTGDWEGWLKFFLRGVQSVSVAATDTARAMLELHEGLRARLADSPNAMRLLDHLFEQPYVSVRVAEKVLRCAYVTAANTIDERVLPASMHESGGRPAYGHEREDGSWHDRDRMRRQAV